MFMRKRTNSLIPVRLGALLVSSNLLKADSMAYALTTSRQSGRQIGEVLVSEGLVSSDDIQAALELQKLIKEGSITVELGIRALRQAHASNDSLKTALNDLGWNDQSSVNSHDLASLLLAAGIVTQEQMQQARWNSSSNYMPLGRNLVLSGSITPSLLGSALNASILMRDGRIDLKGAVDALRTCADKRISLEDIISMPGSISKNHVRIGELLSHAGLLSESDAMNAVESGLLNQRSIGQILLEQDLVSPLVLDAALKLQSMIEENKTTRLQAIELLRQVASKQIHLDEFLSEISYLKSRVLELIVDSGLVDNEEVSIALDSCPQGESDIIRALFMSGALSQELFRAGVRCVYAIDTKTMTEAAAQNYLRSVFSPDVSTEEMEPVGVLQTA